MNVRRRRTAPQIPAGQRVYAIGDIHGEIDLLADLLAAVHQDARSRGPVPGGTTLVLLGDAIDRGAGSATLLRGLANEDRRGLIVLRGNHEAALAAAWRGDARAAQFWREFGGAATLAGFGVPRALIESADAAALIPAMRAHIDEGLIDWIERLPLSWTSGDYFFVHAGVRPGVALHEQAEEDLLWMRDDFLTSRRDHGAVIVHGHTIEPGEVALGGNRIGLDTGGHEHGVLSALGLEGGAQWTVQARRHGAADRGAIGYTPVRVHIAQIVSPAIGPAPEPLVVPEPEPEPEPTPRRARWLGERAGLVPAGAALAVAAAAALLVPAQLRQPEPPARLSPVSAPMPRLAVGRSMPAMVASSPVVMASGPRAPRLPAARLAQAPVAHAPMAQADARLAVATVSAKGRIRSASSAVPPPTPRRDDAQLAVAVAPSGERPVDPYAGLIAKPLTGRAQADALAADRIATRALNLRQLETQALQTRAGIGSRRPAGPDT